jgi:hypothetical protein
VTETERETVMNSEEIKRQLGDRDGERESDEVKRWRDS